MKKLFTWMLAICLLVTSCAILSSCGSDEPPVSEEDVRQDPQSVLNKSFERTGSRFFTDDSGVKDVCEKAMTTGSMTVAFEKGEDDAAPEELRNVRGTVYFNEDGKNLVIDTDFKLLLDGEEEDDLSARIFVDDQGLTLQSKSLFGSDQAYTLKYDAPDEGPGGILGGLIGHGAGLPGIPGGDIGLPGIPGGNIGLPGIPGGDIGLPGISGGDSGLSGILGGLIGQGGGLPGVSGGLPQDGLEKLLPFIKNMQDSLRQGGELGNDFLQAMELETRQETVTDASGKEVECIVVSYHLTNENVLKGFGEKTEQSPVLLQLLQKILQEFEMDLRFNLYINRKTCEYTRIEVDGVGSPKDDPMRVSIHEEVLFSENAISAKVVCEAPDEAPDDAKMEFTARIGKEEKDGTITYTLTADVRENEGQAENLATGTYAYTKKTGAFDLSAVLKGVGEDGEDLNIQIQGSLQASKKSAKMELKTIRIGDLELTSSALSFEWKTGVKVPAAPTDAKDLSQMTEEDFRRMEEDMKKGQLGRLFADED